MDTFITNGEGNFFKQETLAVPHDWLTCTGIGDLEIPDGERTAQKCPDPLNSGQFKIIGFIQGSPGAGTYSMTRPLAKIANWLLEVMCPFEGRINWVCRGNRQDPLNYEVAVLMHNSGRTRRGVPSPVAMTDDDETRVLTNADVNFGSLQILYHLRIARQAIENTGSAHDIFFLPQRCEDRCGPARGLCEEGAMALDMDGYIYESEIKKTHNGGLDWFATADPYTWGGLTSRVLILERYDADVLIAFRGEGVIGAPAECGISLDWGVSWTNVTIGNVHGQYVECYALCGAGIYVGTNDGFIYVSEDNGRTWSIVESGSGTHWYEMCFSGSDGYIVGAGDIVYTSVDGGASWAAAASTGCGALTDLISCAVNLKGHLFVGTDDARLYRSEDEAVSFTEWQDLGAGSIDWIDFDPQDEYVGWLIYNDTGPVGALYRSEDGGATWFEVAGMPVNAGLNRGFICDLNRVFVVGNAHNTTTFVAYTQPTGA